MPLFSMQNPVIKKLLPVFITAISYYFAGKLALLLALPPDYAIASWPPAGIALAAVLLWGYRVLPGIFLAGLFIHNGIYTLSSSLESPLELLIFFLNSITSVIKAWLGCVLVNKFAGFPNALTSKRLILRFFLLAGPVACFLPVLLTVYVLTQTGNSPEQNPVLTILTLWFDDCTGIAVFTPLFFIIFDHANKIWRQRIWFLGLPVCVLFALTSAGYLLAQHYEDELLRKMIREKGHSIRDGLQDVFQRHLSELRLCKELTVTQKIRTETDFRLFALLTFNQHADTSNYQWLEAHKNKGRFYFSSKYAVTREANNPGDFNYVADEANKLDIDSDYKTVINKDHLIIFMPLAETGEKSCQCLKGLVAEVFNLKKLVEAGIDKTIIDHIGLIINNSEDKQKRNPVTIFQSNNIGSLSDPLALANHDSMTLGKQKWSLELTPDKRFLGDYYYRPEWQLFAGGMFLTSSISIGLLGLTGKNKSSRFERDKQDEILIENEQMFRRLVQTQSAIVWQATPVAFRFLYVSDEAVKLLGYPVDQWINEVDFCKKHIHPDDWKAVQAFREAKSRNQDNKYIEFRMIAMDGRCVWLRSFVELIEENAKVTGLFGYMVDITMKKQTEEELRLAATSFESLQGIMITDKNSRILRVNKAFTEITGYSEQQVIGRNTEMLESGRHDPAFYQEQWEQLAANGRFEGEIWNRRKNGEIYPEWQTITAVKNDDGEVSHYVHVFSDITEKKDVENKIFEMAFYDPLTKLPNRRLLLDRFEQELASAKRHNKFGAVIFMDLDHFKLLNDSQGHLAGDQLLIQVANCLLMVLREEDTPARLGGDEFIVLLHANSAYLNIAADQARAVAEKIKGKLNEPFMLNENQHKISTSMGIALFPDNNESPEALLQQADIAMYRSKASGRNTVNFFHTSMQEAADLRMNLEQDIRTAIDSGQFILCYQPQFDAGGALLSAEALIRWEHLKKGVLLPVDFIPIAEESNLILAIGQWVLLETCNQIKVWQDAGIIQPRISANVSYRQFRQQNFVSQVKHAIDSSGIAPHLLGIELTESTMIVDIDDTITKIKALKELGVSIALDEFGTGYSSLMYLKQLPLDTLKIDEKFVRDILTDASDAAIVETIISMAKHLNLNVVAVGVETAEQFAFLKQQGCRGFQGFHFSRPLHASEFAEKYF
jgi:diguanylate cyclase (GGDEF)-like protein/PAS domain S-box-containing protein